MTTTDNNSSASLPECEDCGDEQKRRTRCKHCGLLVCTWCLHHIHHAPHTRRELAEDPSRPEDFKPIKVKRG